MSVACPRCGTENPGGRLAFCPICALADDAEPALPEVPGLVFAAELGRGGMGRVFRARHEALARDVAVKLLAPENTDDPELRRRFEREARTLARLDHPGIVRVYDFGTTPDGEFFLVLELVSGGTLRERLPVPIERGVGLVLELCAALEHAHGQGVIHRDIKPENVLVTAEGKAKLGDFGIARLFGAAHTDTRATSHVIGTLGYLAPEAVSLARPDPRLDVYALGVLLHELLTGRLPGESEALLPARLVTAIRRATAFDPAHRLANTALFAAELRAAVQKLDAPDEPFELPADERPWLGAVALVVSVAAGVSIYAVLASLTPRSITAAEALPLVAFGVEKLANGQVSTRARFEVWPMLGAAVAVSVALVAYGLLRKHWRAAGLERQLPERSLPGTKRVLWFGVGLLLLGFVREALMRFGFDAVVTYIPVLGGVLEFVLLYLFFNVALEAVRTARPLQREPLLWAGLIIGVLTPAYHFVRELGAASGK